MVVVIWKILLMANQNMMIPKLNSGMMCVPGYAANNI